jgi:hypothetical protein
MLALGWSGALVRGQLPSDWTEALGPIGQEPSIRIAVKVRLLPVRTWEFVSCQQILLPNHFE